MGYPHPGAAAAPPPADSQPPAAALSKDEYVDIVREEVSKAMQTAVEEQCKHQDEVDSMERRRQEDLREERRRSEEERRRNDEERRRQQQREEDQKRREEPRPAPRTLTEYAQLPTRDQPSVHLSWVHHAPTSQVVNSSHAVSSASVMGGCKPGPNSADPRHHSRRQDHPLLTEGSAPGVEAVHPLQRPHVNTDGTSWLGDLFVIRFVLFKQYPAHESAFQPDKTSFNFSCLH